MISSDRITLSQEVLIVTDLDSTPRFVSKVYETMNQNLRIVRKKLDRPLTLVPASHNGA